MSARETVDQTPPTTKKKFPKYFRSATADEKVKLIALNRLLPQKQSDASKYAFKKQLSANKTFRKKKSLFSNASSNDLPGFKFVSSQSLILERNEFDFNIEAAKLSVKERKELLKSKKICNSYYSRRSTVYLKGDNPFLEGTLTKFKMVNNKQVKVSRFFRLNERELLLFPSLYSQSLMNEKPLERLVLSDIAQLRTTRTVESDSLTNHLLHCFFFSEEKQDYAYSAFKFDNPTKMKDFLTFYCFDYS